MPKRLIIFLFLSLSGCDQKQTVDQVSGQTMGTTYTVKSQDGAIDQSQIDSRLKQINRVFSNWDKHSELSQVNLQPAHQTILLSSELSKVLSESVRVYQQTDGFFDPGIGRLVDAWGFGITKVASKPDREAIEQALRHSSIAKATFSAPELTKQANIQLNLSAIAKGYAVDEVAKLLVDQGIKRFIVEIGGEIKTQGSWTIGIETPAEQAPIKVELMDESIATSGNYRQYFIWEGKRYAHILDPHTGFPVNSDLFSASVIHKSNLLADAYATAMMAMGSEKAIQLARRLKLKTVLVVKQCDTPCLSKNVIKIGL